VEKSTGKSVSNDWDLVAQSTSPLERVCGFFLIGLLGEILNYGTLARSLECFFHVKGDEFERQYKEYLSDYRSWIKLKHAKK
jgi:hypothetical protein